MAGQRVLVIGSNATRIEVSGGWAPTGQYLNETVVPAMALADAGYELVLATPDGEKPHLDPSSDAPQHFGGDTAAWHRGQRFFAEAPAMNAVRTLRSVIEEGLQHFAAVFVPGGQAPAVDLMVSGEVGFILRHCHDTGKPTALLCHGPIALAAALPRAADFRRALLAGDPVVAAMLADGWPYRGYRMTIFSNTEEKVVEETKLHDTLRFHVADALAAAGGTVIAGPDFAPHVVVDRELITGQNPRSDHLVAARLIAALERSPVPA